MTESLPSGLVYEQHGLELRCGPWGYAPYVAFARGRTPGSPGKAVLLIAGLLEDRGYLLRASVEPALSEAQNKALLESLLASVSYDGTVRSSKWTDEEAIARWQHDVPENIQKGIRAPVQTQHYVVLANDDCAAGLGEKLEENLKRIHGLLQFPEIEWRRPLPVFLFQFKAEYVEFLSKLEGVTPDRAQDSGGRASRDWFATWCRENPELLDPVLLHEAAHGVLTNFLGIHGAGAWFHEGIAEYVSRPRTYWVDTAERIARGDFVPLPELLSKSDLTGDHTEGARSADALYSEAAVFIEFLHDAPAASSQFGDFVQRVGDVTPSDLDKLDRAFQSLYGVGLDKLEGRLIEYCKTR